MRKWFNKRTIGSGSVLAVLVGAAVSAVPSTPVAATPAAAAQPNFFTVSLSAVKATSSTHKHLRVGISASQFSTESINFNVSAKGAPDSHSWNFAGLSSGSVTYNVGTGKGVIKTGKQAKPYGFASLKINNSGKKQVSKCGGFKSITQPVVANGKWSINTRSHGKHKWGKAGKRSKFKGSVFYTTGSGGTGCEGNFPCASSTSWDVAHSDGKGGFDNWFGTLAGRHSTISASRSVQLPKPANASRTDSVFKKDRKQSLKVKKGKATLTVGPPSGASGSAKLLGSNGSTTKQPCGKGKTEKRTDWTAAYKNGSKPLALHEQIEGALKLPNISVGRQEASINKTVA